VRMRVARSTMIRSALSACVAVSMLWTIAIKADENDHLSYPELGITTSGLLIHPSIGYWWDRIGLRVTGMYINKDHHEFHLNIGYAFSDSATVQQSINLLTSWVAGSDPGADYRYGATGIAYSLNYRGFFFEIGLARPWRDDLGNLAHDPVVPCGYWGYIHRFRPE
jgi:hypothetical protein